MAPKGKRGLSIFLRILVVFLCVNIITSGILMVAAFIFHRNAIEKRTKEAVTQQLEILHDSFNNDYQQDLKRSLEVIVSSSLLDDYISVTKFEKAIISKKIEQMFKQTIKTFQTFHNIRFVDADGNVTVGMKGKVRFKESVNLKENDLEALDSTAPTLAASIKLFQTLESIPLLLSGGYLEWFTPPREVQLEGPFTDEDGSLSLLAGISKLDLDVGTFGGVIMIQQKLEKLLNNLRDVKFFDENLIWIFDAEGKLLQKPAEERNCIDPTPYLFDDFQGTPKLMDLKEGLIAYQDFSIIPGKPFVRVAISIPSVLLLKDFSSTIRFFTVVLVSSLILVLLVTLYVSRYLSRPIIELAAAANALSNGDLEAKVAVKTTGEVHMLVDSFNQMIKDLKTQRDEISRSRRNAEQANQAKSEFLANMSHELRTPLNHIIGFSQILIDKSFGELNEVQEEYLTDVYDSSKHLLSLINDILDLSKVEAGKLEYHPSEVRIKDVLTNSLIMIKEKALKHGIQTSANFNEISDTIQADERKIKQILYNLLSNSVKFTPDQGQILLSAKHVSHIDTKRQGVSSDGKNYLLISVKDNGIGLKREDIERIFKPFEQVENSASRRFPGTGLGLSLTQNLVQLHGGKIWAESEGEGKGTAIFFCIPVVVKEIGHKLA